MVHHQGIKNPPSGGLIITTALSLISNDHVASNNRRAYASSGPAPNSFGLFAAAVPSNRERKRTCRCARSIPVVSILLLQMAADRVRPPVLQQESQAER